LLESEHAQAFYAMRALEPAHRSSLAHLEVLVV
jgi:hypothetical protein